MNTALKVFTGFLVGALAGTAIGLLTAPDKGERTRKKIQKDAKRMAEDFSDTALKKFGEVKNELNDKIDELIDKGKHKAEKLTKTMSHN